MSIEHTDLQALAAAMEAFTRSTQTMEEAYTRLQERVSALDRELEDKNRKLALTTDYLSNLLESISDGCIAIDTDGVITRFNRAATAILGFAAADIVGRSFKEVFKRDFTAPRLPGSLELMARSGRPVPVSERDSPIADHEQRRLGTVKTFQDLSELIALREQVRQIDRLAAVGEMAATVAHEIRNPLGGIRGFAAFLAQDIADEDPRKRLVLKIQEGTRSLDRVVSELLEYTRPIEIVLRPISCAELIDTALGFFDLEGRPIEIRQDLEPGLRALADRDKLRQVLLNLLLNAAQSIEGEGRIEVSARAENGWACIRVQDTGCGMEPMECKKVFSPFYTTKEKGTGLGLAVSQKIIEGHGGSIGVESSLDVGTTFTVRLPRSE
jgi:PAS domain S-box-containing protein